MIYNTTLLTNASNYGAGEFVCTLNYLSDSFIAYVILVLVLLVSLTVIIKKGNTYYTALPTSFFFTSVIATLMVFFECHNKLAVPIWIVISLWVATALFTGIRAFIK